MTRIRRLALPIAVALLGVGAAPAHATLEVSSNSTDGLIVKDKNGISDLVSITSGTSQGDPVYFITSTNPTDVFKYDLKQGCSQGSSGQKAVCQRLRSKINLAMGGGDDIVSAKGATAASSASVNLGTGNDSYEGIDS